ncbi:hypothetical protein H4W80_010522 [Nonomuraea angiospora]|uniref:Uncharacterized protein n=1 Tax=Nonomuraea angiospora TaxID=46172 RepID=A0ABR9MH62_9ACTN|nr:hypothetical protein [Nonomuraea angiospora]
MSVAGAIRIRPGAGFACEPARKPDDEHDRRFPITR